MVISCFEARSIAAFSETDAAVSAALQFVVELCDPAGPMPLDDETPALAAAASSQIVAQLVANHRDFLRFVERRVGNRAIAEEIIQEAFVTSLDQAGEVRDSVVGWFYRVLRNAVVDYQRRQAVANRRLDLR